MCTCSAIIMCYSQMGPGVMKTTTAMMKEVVMMISLRYCWLELCCVSCCCASLQSL